MYGYFLSVSSAPYNTCVNCLTISQKFHSPKHCVSGSGRCESVYNSTESYVTATTPIVTPNVQTPKRNYQLRVGPPSPKSKSSYKSPSIETQPSPNKDSSSQISNKDTKSRALKRSQTESSSDFMKATLRRQRTNSKHAPIFRNNTLENMLALPKDTNTGKIRDHDFIQKRKSATCSDFSALRIKDDSPTLHEEKVLSAETNAEKPVLNSNNFSKVSQYRRQRPRNLSIIPNYSPNESTSPRSPFSRKANLSLPNLRRM